MADKKKKIVEVDAEDEEHLTQGQSTAPQNKVEKAVIREGPEHADKTLKKIREENVEEEDPEVRRQTDLEVEKHIEKVESMEEPDENLPEAEKKKRAGYVKINMYETITPAPVIGGFRVGHELGISSMQARATYSVPKNVADVLVDSRKAGRVD
jgi:hypothetical protein